MAFYINAKQTQVSATPTKAQCVHNATNVSCKKCELLVKYVKNAKANSRSQQLSLEHVFSNTKRRASSDWLDDGLAVFQHIQAHN